MRRASLAVLLAFATTTSGCATAAVVSMVGGGALTVGGAVAMRGECDTEGCAMTKALGAVAFSVGVILVGAGGVYFIGREVTDDD